MSDLLFAVTDLGDRMTEFRREMTGGLAELLGEIATTAAELRGEIAVSAYLSYDETTGLRQEMRASLKESPDRHRPCDNVRFCGCARTPGRA